MCRSNRLSNQPQSGGNASKLLTSAGMNFRKFSLNRPLASFVISLHVYGKMQQRFPTDLISACINFQLFFFPSSLTLVLSFPLCFFFCPLSKLGEVSHNHWQTKKKRKKYFIRLRHTFVRILMRILRYIEISRQPSTHPS